MEERYTLKYEEIDTRTDKVIKDETFTDTLDNLMTDGKYHSMHTFQMTGQCTSDWYKSRGFSSPGRDWNKWVEIVGDSIDNFVNILNEIEAENRQDFIDMKSNGTIVHTLRRYHLLSRDA